MNGIQAIKKYGFIWWKYLFKIPIPYIKIKIKWYNIKIPMLPDENNVLIHQIYIKVKEKSHRKKIIQQKIKQAINQLNMEG